MKKNVLFFCQTEIIWSKSAFQKWEEIKDISNKSIFSFFSGAEVNLNIDGIDLRQALIKTFGPEILNFQPSDLEDAIKVKFPRSWITSAI